MPGTRGWCCPSNRVLGDGDVCTHSCWHSAKPAPSAATAALPEVLQGCLSLLTSACGPGVIFG